MIPLVQYIVYSDDADDETQIIIVPHKNHHILQFHSFYRVLYFLDRTRAGKSSLQ